MSAYHKCGETPPPTCKGMKKGLDGYHRCLRAKKCLKSQAVERAKLIAKHRKKRKGLAKKYPLIVTAEKFDLPDPPLPKIPNTKVQRYDYSQRGARVEKDPWKGWDGVYNYIAYGQMGFLGKNKATSVTEDYKESKDMLEKASADTKLSASGKKFKTFLVKQCNNRIKRGEYMYRVYKKWLTMLDEDENEYEPDAKFAAKLNDFEMQYQIYIKNRGPFHTYIYDNTKKLLTMTSEKSIVKLFDLKHDYTQAELKKSYRKLALRWHPDKKNGNAKKFKKINELYEKLRT